jgi:hypothetical protein
MKTYNVLFAILALFVVISTATAEESPNVNMDDPKMNEPTLNQIPTAGIMDLANSGTTGEENGRACCGVENFGSTAARDAATSADTDALSTKAGTANR